MFDWPKFLGTSHFLLRNKGQTERETKLQYNDSDWIRRKNKRKYEVKTSPCFKIKIDGWIVRSNELSISNFFSQPSSLKSSHFFFITIFIVIVTVTDKTKRTSNVTVIRYHFEGAVKDWTGWSKDEPPTNTTIITNATEFNTTILPKMAQSSGEF